MRTKALVWLILGASVMNGALAGGGINRALVHMPAWRHVGPVAWAHFSRFADLGLNAMILYPLEAVTGLVLSAATAILFYRTRGGARAAAIPIYAAAGFSAGGLLLTLKAAPILLSVRHLGEDSASLQRAFDGFEFWGDWRTVSQVLAFFANLASLAALACAPPAGSQRGPR